MKPYKVQEDMLCGELKVGEVIWMGNEGIRVITILKVDFHEKSVYFHGVSENDLNN